MRHASDAVGVVDAMGGAVAWWRAVVVDPGTAPVQDCLHMK
jgi:hypothetical protein